MRFTRAFALTTLVLGTTSGFADDICEAVVLRDIAALESPSSIIRKGQLDTSITQFRVDKRNGDTSFCSHGGYCYPTHVKVGGDKLQALRMKNCTVDAQGQDEKGDDYVIYAVIPLPKTMPSDRQTSSRGMDVPAQTSRGDAPTQPPPPPSTPLRAEYGTRDIPMLLNHQDGDEFVTHFMGHSFASTGRFVSFEKADLPTTASMYMGSVMTAGGQVVCLFNQESGVKSLPYSQGDTVVISGQLGLALPSVLMLGKACSISRG